MLHAKEKDLVPRSELHLIPVNVRKEVSEHWQGINHGVLADTLIDRLRLAGLTPTKEQWILNPGKDILWGCVDVDNESAALEQRGLELQVGQDAHFTVGIRHSNNGRYAVSMIAGARVEVCSNGIFYGDYTLKKRHTDSLVLEDMIDTGIKEYLIQVEGLDRFILAMQTTPITDERAALAMMYAHRKGLVNFRYLELVDLAWTSPPYMEFQARSAWSLYNAFTWMAKELSAPRQLTLLAGLKELIIETCGVSLERKR